MREGQASERARVSISGGWKVQNKVTIGCSAGWVAAVVDGLVDIDPGPGCVIVKPAVAAVGYVNPQSCHAVWHAVTRAQARFQ